MIPKITMIRNVLLIEDCSKKKSDTLKELIAAGYEVTFCKDIVAAGARYQKRDFTYCVIARSDMDNLSFIRSIRRENALIVNAVIEDALSDDKIISSLKSGADIVIEKNAINELPFRMERFERFIQSSLQETLPSFWLGNLCCTPSALIDKDSRYHIKVTKRQFEVLEILYRNINRIVSREALLCNAYGKELYYTKEGLLVIMHHLRQCLKLEENVVLENIHGIGYRLNLTTTCNSQNKSMNLTLSSNSFGKRA